MACDSDFFLNRGECVLSCPVGMVQAYSDTGNYCEEESKKFVAWKLISDLPLAYFVMACFLVAAILKLTCLRNISLLVTFVIISSFVETVSLFELLILTAKDHTTAQGLNGFEKGCFRFMPLGALLTFLLLNLFVITHHCSALKPGAKASDESKAEYETWIQERTAKRTVIYTVSCLCSFHNINWFNYFGLFPDSLKRRMIRQQFIEFYTRMSKFSMVFPRTLMLCYCAYFGVFNAQGRIDAQTESSADILACIVEHSFLCVMSVFLLFLAINFSWYDDPIEIIKQHELHK